MADANAANLEKIEASFREEHEDVNVHWLHCVGQRGGEVTVEWKRTRGKTDAVAPFVLAASDACVKEPSCVHAAEAVRDAAAWGHKCGLLVGVPGMGKSRFLQRLAAEARARAPERWAVLLQALDHRNLLKDLPEPQELTEAHLVKLLAAAAGGTEAARRYLHAALYHTGAIAVFVDGVDEVCPSFKEKLVQLLKMLLQTQVQLVWVSSRPEVEGLLRTTLRCPTSSLRPFTEVQQEEYLCRHWASTCSHSPAEFQSLAGEMVAALHSAAGRSQRSLLDVPLHAQMAAEAYEAQAVEALSTGGSLLAQSGISLYQLYRRFVDKKRDLYKQRFGLKDANFENIAFTDNFDELHQKCALLILTSDETYGSMNSLPFREYLEKSRTNLIKEKNGILWLGEDEMPRFLHFTFMEYFSASWIFSQVNDREGTSETARDLWLRFLVHDVGSGVKQMLEHMLAEGHPLHLAVLEGSEQALEAALEASSDPNETDRFGRTALLLAATLGRADAVGALLARGCDPGRRDALLGWTALLYASTCQQLEAAERLLEAGADSNELIIYDIEETAFKAAEFGFTEIMDFLLKKGLNSNLQNTDEETLLLIAAEHGHTRTAQKLINYAADVNKKNKFGAYPLSYSVTNGNHELSKLLLENKAEPNTTVTIKNRLEQPLLIIAVEKGDVTSVRLLLKHGAEANQCDTRNWFALQYAISRDFDEITDLLLQNNANPNVVNEDMKTPLMLAADRGYGVSTQLLLQHGADADRCDKHNWTALHFATSKDRKEITSLLLERNANPNVVNTDKKTPLMLAAEKGGVQSARLLLQFGADVNSSDKRNWTALHYAISNGLHEIMSLLLEQQANPNAVNQEGQTPLMLAAEKGHVVFARLLLDRGADPNECDLFKRSALDYATSKGQHEVTSLLLEKNANPNSVNRDKKTPLMLAAKEGDVVSVRSLLEHGADPNKSNWFQRNALHYATSNGHHEITSLLLSYKADPNSVDEDERTPLMLAARKGGVFCARLLLQHGAGANQRDKDNWTALHYASMCHHHEITSLLLEHNANPNAASQKKATPLILAAMKNSVLCSRLLLQYGADANQCDADNCNALHYAINGGHHEIVKLLKSEHSEEISTKTYPAKNKEGKH